MTAILWLVAVPLFHNILNLIFAHEKIVVMQQFFLCIWAILDSDYKKQTNEVTI